MIKSLLLIVAMFWVSFARADGGKVVPPQHSSAEFPTSAIIYFNSDLIFVGRIEKIVFKDKLQMKDTIVLVRPSRKIFRGSVDAEMKLFVGNVSDGLTEGKDYLFKVNKRKNKYHASAIAANSASSLIAEYEYVVKDGSNDEEKILSNFLEFKKMKAQEWRDECDKMQGSDKKACLKGIDSILRG